MTTSDSPTPTPTPTHAAYSDETRYNYGRVRGLGLLSLPSATAPALGAEVRALLAASGVAECKWERIRSARGRFAAEKLLTWTLAAASAGRLRVDVLTWDAEDGAALPYLARLRQQYARLVGEILPRRWPAGSRFALFPDEQAAMPWPALVAGMPHVASIAPRRSEAEPLIQVADLFAGLGAYSRGNYATYEAWLCYPPAERARDLRRPCLPFSASDRMRCALLDDFYTASKFGGLGISLRTQRGLRTYTAARPIAFWWG
ncbi:MAG TPA: hypothetical protein VFY89_07700 [Ktedonobacterales bacterium]